MAVILGRFFGGEQLFARDIGQLEMYPAVFKIIEEQVDCFFKVFIVFDECFVKLDIGNGRTAGDAVRIGGGNRVQERGESLAVTPLALPDAKLQRLTCAPAVGRGGGMRAKPFMMRVVAKQIADEKMITEEIGLILKKFIERAVELPCDAV